MVNTITTLSFNPSQRIFQKSGHQRWSISVQMFPSSLLVTKRISEMMSTHEGNLPKWNRQGLFYLVKCMTLIGIFHPKMNISWKCTRPQAIKDVDEFISSSGQIWRNVALNHLLSNVSPAVNGCRQNESPNSWLKHHNKHKSVLLLLSIETYFTLKQRFKAKKMSLSLHKTLNAIIMRFCQYCDSSLPHVNAILRSK